MKIYIVGKTCRMMMKNYSAEEVDELFNILIKENLEDEDLIRVDWFGYQLAKLGFNKMARAFKL